MITKDFTLTLFKGPYEKAVEYKLQATFQDEWELDNPFWTDVVINRVANTFIKDNNIQLTPYGFQTSYIK